jgi:hypothetical protein
LQDELQKGADGLQKQEEKFKKSNIGGILRAIYRQTAHG